MSEKRKHAIRQRPIQVKFFVDESELGLIKARMAQQAAHDDRGKLYAQAPAGAAERLQSERGQQMDLAGCEYPGWRGRDACVCGQERCCPF